MRYPIVLATAAIAFALNTGAAQAFFFAPFVGHTQNETDPRALQQAPRSPELVRFNAEYAPGTIVVSTSQRRLYLVLPNGEAIRYSVGVGRPGFAWSGVHKISRKAAWPSWTPPAEMLKRRPDLPRFMEGGEDNPLGARALYLGSSLYRIHGSNEPNTIGQAVSSGCIWMANEDIADLYDRVPVGATVVVLP
jgi:lipoprotein-anchoring transpeptidase ErfK/SrfK